MELERSVSNMCTAVRVLRSSKRTLGKEDYLAEKVTTFPGWLIINFWKRESNRERKDEYEYLIAKKLNSFNPVIAFNPVPDIYSDYLEEVSSIDAIVELLKNQNPTVYEIARAKYVDFFNSYLDYEESVPKVIDFEKGRSKVIQFNGGNYD